MTMTTKPTKTVTDSPTPPGLAAQVADLLKRPYTMVVRGDPQDGYLAEVSELAGCISAGDTPSEALTMLREAMAGWFGPRLIRGLVFPEPQPLLPSTEHFSGRILVRTSPYFHRALMERARKEGVSLNQWV